MKTTIHRILTVFFLQIVSFAMAFADDKELDLFRTSYETIDDDPIKHRTPSHPLRCSIGEDSIFIQGYDAEEIQSYEAYDINGVCHLATEDPQVFCEFVLSNDNALEIRIYTSDYILRGYVDASF